MKYRFTLSIGFLAVLLFSGCQNGVMKLPAVNLSEPLAAHVAFGPSAGILPGVHVANATFPLGHFCDAIDKAAIEAQVRAVVGDTVGSMIQINRVLLTGIVISTRNRDFSGFENLSIAIQPDGGDAVSFGSISGEDGLGTGFTINATQTFDALTLLGDAHCLSATLTYTGTTPASDLDLRLDAYVTVEAQASVS